MSQLPSLIAKLETAKLFAVDRRSKRIKVWYGGAELVVLDLHGNEIERYPTIDDVQHVWDRLFHEKWF